MKRFDPNQMVNKISKDTQTSLFKRVILAAVMIAVVFPCIIFGGWFYLVLVLVVIGAATYEVAKAPCHRLSWFVWIATFLVMYALIFWALLKENIPTGFKDFSIYTSFKTIWLSPFALAIMIGVYAFMVVLKEDFYITDAFYLVAMTLVLSIGFQSVLYIRYIPFSLFQSNGMNASDLMVPKFKYFQSSFLLIYLLLGVLFNDAGAYFVGIFFGKHKINPRISPKKTWEGFFGGIVISTLISMGFGMIVAKYNMPMVPTFNLQGWYWILICSLMLPLVGNLGDFTFSAIKRHFAIKDFSHFLGPHGGVLDRIDSTMFGAIALTCFVTFVTNGWNFYVK